MARAEIEIAPYLLADLLHLPFDVEIIGVSWATNGDGYDRIVLTIRGEAVPENAGVPTVTQTPETYEWHWNVPGVEEDTQPKGDWEVQFFAEGAMDQQPRGELQQYLTDDG